MKASRIWNKRRRRNRRDEGRKEMREEGRK